jgi:glycosyltransferase involved in cell wall biosynthesis
MEPISLSIVVPLFNEEGNAVRLAKEITQALKGQSYEMIFVDDASTDETLTRLIEAKATLPALRVLHHQKNAGQSAAIRTGALAARGTLLAILDGDGQNDPADLPRLIECYSAAHPPPGMVAGKRTDRQDRWSKRMGSKFGNAVRRMILRDGASDAGCGLKVLALETYVRLPFFDHQHRYMAALVRREDLAVAYIPVGHRARLSGQSSYTNIGRLLLSIPDLFGVLWLQSRAKKPGKIDEL